MSKKISVIGGSGFVGTNFCQRLSDKHIDFEIIDIRPSRQFANAWKFGDVRSIDSLRKSITGEIIIHLAAVHRDDISSRREYYHTNVKGAKNIAKVCVEKGVDKLVFTSTVAVYGFAEPGTDENGPIVPFNEYGRTKFLAEEEFRNWQKVTGGQLIIVRPTVIFGEGNRGNVFNLFHQIYRNKFVMIGSGKNKKSMAYIANVVAFLESCVATKQDYAIYNYVDTPDLDMNTLVRKVKIKLTNNDKIVVRIPLWLGLLIGYSADILAFLSSRKLAVSSIRVRKFCATTHFSSAKHDMDGFVQPFGLEEAINQTLHSEFISPDPEMEIFHTE